MPTRAPLLTRGTHRYKAGTAEFTSWLADAANTGGVDLKDIILPAPTGNSERKKTPRRQQLSTQNIYFISIRHFPDLAQTVANFENRRIIVPRGIYNLLSDIIALRKAVSEMWIQGAFGPSSSGGDDRHVCFINILKKVKEILKGRVEKTVVDTKFPAPNYELGNFFAALNVEEPKLATASVEEPVKRSQKKPEAKYELELDSGLDGIVLSSMFFFQDLRNIQLDIIALVSNSRTSFYLTFRGPF